MFLVSQVLGAALGKGLALDLYPDSRTAGDAVLVPHTHQTAAAADGDRNHTTPTVERTTT